MERSEELLKRLIDAVSRVVVGQHELVEGLVVGLVAGGHVLVEGVPGLAKTTAVRTLAEVAGLPFRRVQFTPDLLPGDLTGNPIFQPDRGTYTIRKGPIFASVVVADEINRAPAKVQSALLEAMEERQVTIGEETHPLPDPFLVMATQNPVELDGTYPLPEAQVDRFMMKLLVPYPGIDEERIIAARAAGETEPARPVTDAAGILGLRDAVAAIHLAPEIVDYAVRVVRATRDPVLPGRSPGAPAVALGASPRASIHLVQAARARALVEGRRYATPHDVKHMAAPVLRHRIQVGYEAEADGIRPEDVVAAVLDGVPIP